jgi:dephospho-CoA kinase
MNYTDRMRAFHALHAYEGLEDLENDGDEDAAKLREKLFEQYIEAWEELRPAVLGESSHG